MGPLNENLARHNFMHRHKHNNSHKQHNNTHILNLILPTFGGVNYEDLFLVLHHLKVYLLWLGEC